MKNKLIILLLLTSTLPVHAYINNKEIHQQKIIVEKLSNPSIQYLGLIWKWSGMARVPFKIAVSIVKNESLFDTLSINKNKNKTFDRGLMQLNSSNYEEFKWRFNKGHDFNPHEPSTNIRIGCLYLRWIFDNRKIGKKDWYRTIVFWNGSKKSSRLFAKKVLSEI